MSQPFRQAAALLLFLFSCGLVQAGLFDDAEARRAILDLRERVDAVRKDAETSLGQQAARAAEENALLRRSLLDLQTQIETQRIEMTRLVGQNEQLARDIVELQRQQKEMLAGVDQRLSKYEPLKVSVDGREFVAEQVEKRDYEAALGIFRKGDFNSAQLAFAEFTKRYPASGYAPSAFFWLGNAQYATREYQGAIQNFRSLLTLAPDHLRAPEAVLSIANCQIELKDTKAARKTLEDLMKAYPESEAASAAKNRLARLK